MRAFYWRSLKESEISMMAKIDTWVYTTPANIDPNRVPAGVREVAGVLRANGYQAWIVGGCVRDLLRGQAHRISDWDLTTEALPETVLSLFPKVVPTGLQHGTVTVIHDGEGYEVTTLRGEGAYSDGRRPDQVFFVKNIIEDLARRDFTINAIAADPVTGNLTDPFNGLVDLSNKVLRAVGDANERFAEDGLRVLRAARFCSVLDFEMDRATKEAIRPNLDTFAKVAKERVLAELMKAIGKSASPSVAFSLMRETGILDVIGGPLSALDDEQFETALRKLDRAAPLGFALGLAALLDHLPEREVDTWLRAMTVSNAHRETVVGLIRGLRDAPSHERMLKWSDAQLRRWASKLGPLCLDAQLLYVCLEEPELDLFGNTLWRGKEVRDRFLTVLGPDTVLELKGLAVSGDDLQEHLGLKPSKRMGELLKELLDVVLENPERNTKEQLLEEARQRLHTT